MPYVEAILKTETRGIVNKDELASTPITLDSLPVIRIDDQTIKKSAPTIVLEGTETGAKKYSIKESAGKVAIRNETDAVDEISIDPATRVTINRNLTAGGVALEAHQARHIAGGADALSGVTKAQLAADTIRLEIPIPLGFIPTGLATDATGVKFESKQYLVSADVLACAKAAYFETDLQQLTGGTVALELYDYTAAAVVASLSQSATTKRVRSADIKASLVSGNPVGVQFNVTTAGAAGSVGGGCSPVLIVVIGIS
jgi:hypothetical protein